MYMALTLLIGLGALNQLASDLPNYILRKGFHALAFMLFVPPIIMAKIDRPRMLIFAFNCVTVALIIIEVLRYSGGILPESFSKWFKSMSNGRERIPANMIVTHIYLLMGCAFPPTASFILLSGGVYNSEWTLWSLSGVVFLGIGDSCAAVFGKQYGKTLWR
jgi:dolichol kinase